MFTTRKDLQDEMSSIKNQLESVGAENTSLKEALKNANEDREQLQVKLEASEADFKKAMQELEAAQESVNEAEKKLASFDEEVADAARVTVSKLGVDAGTIEAGTEKPKLDITQQYAEIKDPVERSKFALEHRRELRLAIGRV